MYSCLQCWGQSEPAWTDNSALDPASKTWSWWPPYICIIHDLHLIYVVAKCCPCVGSYTSRLFEIVRSAYCGCKLQDAAQHGWSTLTAKQLNKLKMAPPKPDVSIASKGCVRTWDCKNASLRKNISLDKERPSAYVLLIILEDIMKNFQSVQYQVFQLLYYKISIVDESHTAYIMDSSICIIQLVHPMSLAFQKWENKLWC